MYRPAMEKQPITVGYIIVAVLTYALLWAALGAVIANIALTIVAVIAVAATVMWIRDRARPHP